MFSCYDARQIPRDLTDALGVLGLKLLGKQSGRQNIKSSASSCIIANVRLLQHDNIVDRSLHPTGGSRSWLQVHSIGRSLGGWGGVFTHPQTAPFVSSLLDRNSGLFLVPGLRRDALVAQLVF